MKKLLIWSICVLSVVPAAAAWSARRNVPPGVTWYWQLSGTPDSSYSGAKLYDIDMEDTPTALIKRLQHAGHVVICYFSAGSYEPWRHDASTFPRASIGKKLQGWNEYYLDIRDPAIREIILGRMDRARRKGCDGIEPDVLDAFANPSGFPITRQDEIGYIKWLASEGHRRRLLVALKNDPELVPAVVGSTDFVVAEQCFEDETCLSYRPFIAQGKAVLLAEYSGFSAEDCARARALGFSLAFFDRNLDGRTYRSCD